jgi:hypothetical protein
VVIAFDGQNMKKATIKFKKYPLWAVKSFAAKSNACAFSNDQASLPYLRHLAA